RGFVARLARPVGRRELWQTRAERAPDALDETPMAGTRRAHLLAGVGPARPVPLRSDARRRHADRVLLRHVRSAPHRLLRPRTRRPGRVGLAVPGPVLRAAEALLRRLRRKPDDDQAFDTAVRRGGRRLSL